MVRARRGASGMHNLPYISMWGRNLPKLLAKLAPHTILPRICSGFHWYVVTVCAKPKNPQASRT